MARTRTVHDRTALDTAVTGHAVPVMALWHEALDGLAGGLNDVEATLMPAASRTAAECPLIAPPAVPTIDVAAAMVHLRRQGAVVRFRDPRLQDVLLLRPHSRLRDSHIDRRLVFALRDHLEALLLADTGA